jgi:putative Mg2+ transporter-C (MgtC) family protein
MGPGLVPAAAPDMLNGKRGGFVMDPLLAFVLDIGTALLLGMALGVERQLRQHPAGLRTNTLVCVGAALFVSLSFRVGAADPTRIAGQVVSGIGFLGGGVILREGLNVRGMSTAATLWCSAAIGTLAGGGRRAEAALGAAAVLAVHLGLRPVVKRIDARLKGSRDVETFYRVRVVCREQDAPAVRTIILRHINAVPAMTVQGLSTQDGDRPDQGIVVAEIFSQERNDKRLDDLISRLGIEPSVTSVSWERLR